MQKRLRSLLPALFLIGFCLNFEFFLKSFFILFFVVINFRENFILVDLRMTKIRDIREKNSRESLNESDCGISDHPANGMKIISNKSVKIYSREVTLYSKINNPQIFLELYSGFSRAAQQPKLVGAQGFPFYLS